MEETRLRQEVRRAARGDADAAAILFDHYYPRVFRYAVARLRRREDAEDVASETFARVLDRLERFRWKGAGFEAWLFRIAANLVVDRTRQAGREIAGETADDLSLDPGRTPEETALFAADAAELRNRLAGLPEDQREVLVLRFAAELDTEEIGKVMGRRANAVRQLQFRALSNLRAALAQEASR